MKASLWIVAACLSAQLFAPAEALAQAKPGTKSATPAAKPGAKGADSKSDPKGEPTPKEKAASFVKSGDKSAAAGEWEDAYADYSIAWTMYQGWETALGVGKAANKTGHHAEAVERLTYYLREAPPKNITAKQQAEIDALIAESTSKTGLLKIVAPDGGDVFVDRNPVGKTPLPNAIRLDPGKHEIEIRRATGGETKSAELAAGATLEVKFEPPKAGPPKVIIKEDSYRWRTPALITGAGLTVAGLALGGVTLGLTFDKSAAKNEAAKDPRGYDAALAAAKDEALFKEIMIWSFVGAGVALAGTAVVYFVIKPPEKPKTTGSLGVGVRGTSLFLHGEF